MKKMKITLKKHCLEKIGMKYLDIGDFGDADCRYDVTFDDEFLEANVYIYN